MDFTIRPARREDAEGIRHILGEVDSFHRDALPMVFRRPRGPVRSDAFLAEAIEDEEALLVVAELGGAIIGMEGVHKHYALEGVDIHTPFAASISAWSRASSWRPWAPPDPGSRR